ncbi:unnamed protein product [Thelazia callipaeda]|uniref:Uncharacterized protein n=1 Tax=Thelazia callipaeda TaxID=103827 RepID=A0A0N5D2G9_THECL|nr:unnamed protein product [Thelazia callipaeda]
MPTEPLDEKKILPEEESRSQFWKDDDNDPYADSPDTEIASLSETTQMPFMSSEKRIESLQSRLFVPASSRVSLAKTLAHKKLRKYASETCFAPEPSNSTDLLSKKISEKEVPVTTVGKNKIFSIQPVSSTACGMILHDGSPPYYQPHKREDSEGETSGSGSDATVASTTVTPILRNKSRYSRSNWRKSATHVFGTSVSSDAYNTPTSATILSMDSLQQPGLGMVARRENSLFIMDDDSLHEFDDEKGNFINDSVKSIN